LPIVLIAALVLGVIALLLQGLDAALTLWARIEALPHALQLLLAVCGGAVGLGLIGALIWWFRRPKRPRSRPVDRAAIERRLAELGAGTAAAELRAELDALDARAAQTNTAFVALFGAISTGKSSLIRALAPEHRPDVHVLGGTTVAVREYPTRIGAHAVTLVDVPGTEEWGGEARAVAARLEALRAHVVLYVVDGDLTRPAAGEIEWLQRFGKPMLLVLNKIDHYTPEERDRLLERLRQRSGLEVLPCRAGGPDDAPHRDYGVEPLRAALQRALAQDRSRLEQARERAVLQGLDLRLELAAAQRRDTEAEALVRRHARRAVVAGLATVAPGSDLVIQSVLAGAMLRELAQLHGVGLGRLELDDLLRAVGGRRRGSGVLLLAIAGKALKAFPGAGTLGGGLAHALADGLVFHSLGQAVHASLTEHRRLDHEATLQRFGQALAAAEHLRRWSVELAREALIDPERREVGR
jgi:GTP-binding protein EngB required for normal cell division